MAMPRRFEQNFTMLKNWFLLRTTRLKITKSSYHCLFLTFRNKVKNLKTVLTDIQIIAQFSGNVPANTEAFAVVIEAFAVVISDKNLIFQSDGNKMRVVY